MSYDFFFFKVNPKHTVAEINDFLASEQFQQYIEARADETEDDEADDDRPLIPAQFIDYDYDLETLQDRIGRAWLAVTVPEERHSEEFKAYLDDPEADLPDEFADEIEMLFEYSPVGGMQPLMFGYGGLEDAFSNIAGVFAVLEDEGIAAFDPQLDKVLDIHVLEQAEKTGGFGTENEKWMEEDLSETEADDDEDEEDDK